MKFFLVPVVLGICVQFAQAAVVHLTEANFRDVVDGSQHALVEFYAPWCGHCKALKPEYEIVGETYKDGDGVVIAAVDATENKQLASEFGVKGYPTLKYFPKGSTTAEDFDGGRTADTIITWINKRTGLNRKVKKAPSAVTDLTTSTFDAAISSPDKFAIVEFYAPWCGHCKQLAPKYEKLAQAFAGEPNVLIAKVDATEEKELAQKFEVTGYPTLIYFEKGQNKDHSKYTGPREEDGLLSFVNEKAGTFRNIDGSLKAQAGRNEQLDTLVKGRAANADAALLASVQAAVAEWVGDQAEIGERYVKVVEKIIAKGQDYVSGEMQRLERMLQGSVASDKKTGFMLRLNVLRAFE